ncbi:MAG: hypothetical protein ACYS9X_16285 [Planctomycetota bacterium]
MRTKDLQPAGQVRQAVVRCLIACAAIAAVFVGLFVACPAIVGAVFRWDFSRRAVAYEDFYRRHNATCYRQWEMEPESAWFLTMTEDDYAGSLRELADSSDADVSYWAGRTLVNGYPRSAEAKALVYGWIDDPAADPELQMSAALTLADWADGSRLARQIEVFGSAPEDSCRYWLGLHLASVGECSGLRYSLARLGREPDLAGEICPRLRECASARPGAFEAMRNSDDPEVLRGIDEFDRWLASQKR